MMTLSEWVSYVGDIFERMPAEEQGMRNYIIKEVVEHASNKYQSKMIELELEKDQNHCNPLAKK